MAKGKGNPPEKQTRQSRSFMKDSVWVRVTDETRQGWGLRKNLIQKLEDILGGMVVLYFTAFTDERVVISDVDAEMIENILSVEHEKGSKIFLVLNSPEVYLWRQNVSSIYVELILMGNLR